MRIQCGCASSWRGRWLVLTILERFGWARKILTEGADRAAASDVSRTDRGKRSVPHEEEGEGALGSRHRLAETSAEHEREEEGTVGAFRLVSDETRSGI